MNNELISTVKKYTYDFHCPCSDFTALSSTTGYTPTMRSDLTLKPPSLAQIVTRGLLCVFIPSALVACPDTTAKPIPIEQGGSISGSISLGLSLTSQRLRSSAALKRIIPGRVIIKRKTGLQTLGFSSLHVSGLNLERTLGNGAGVYRATGLNAQATLNLAAKLNAQPGIEYAEPDRAVRASDVTSTDSRFAEQWNLQAPSSSNPSGMNLPAVWPISTGLSGTGSSMVIAVIDTGILGSSDASKTHPEFTGRVLPGFDFVSDVFLSNDGDARDADPFDPGDSSDGTGGYHGSHVAGIAVAGITTSGSSPAGSSIGMVGVAPNASILPLRALGVNGEGSLSDVLEAMLWAAGSSVTGAGVNAHPADVLNLSLGDIGSCSRATQDTINTVLARPQRPVIVVAAGNDNIDSSSAFPANCDGVIGVGVLNQKGERASYSNYGAFVDVMAPGGDFNTSGAFDAQSAILGPWWNAGSKSFSYQLEAGTSMAAPHIAGLVALMKSVVVNPADINTTRVLEIFRANGTALSATACNRSSGSACGAGMIDAVQSLGMAAGTVPVPTTNLFSLSALAANLSILPGSSSDLELHFERASGFAGPISVTATSSNPEVSAQVSAVSIKGDMTTLKLEVNPKASSGEAEVTVQAGSNNFKLERIIRVIIPPERTLISTFVIALKLNLDGSIDVNSSHLEPVIPAGSTGLAVTLGTFELPDLEPGKYLLAGLKDVNQNRIVDAGDYLGSYSQDAINSSPVRPPKQDADFDLELFSSNTPSLNSFSSLTVPQRSAINQLLGRLGQIR
jgi:serine protease